MAVESVKVEREGLGDWDKRVRAAKAVEQAGHEVAVKKFAESTPYRPRHLGKVIWWTLGWDTRASESQLTTEITPSPHTNSALSPEQVRAELSQLSSLRDQLAKMRAKQPLLASHARLEVLLVSLARSLVMLQSLCGKLEELDAQEELLEKIYDAKLRKDLEHALILSKQKTAHVIKTGTTLFLACVNIAGGIVATSTGVGGVAGAVMISSGLLIAFNTAADQLQLYEKGCQKLGMDPKSTQRTCRVLTRVTLAASFTLGSLSLFSGGLPAVTEGVDAAIKGFFAGSSAVGAAADGLAGARQAKIMGEQVLVEGDMLSLSQQFTEVDQKLQELHRVNEMLMGLQQELTQFMAKLPES